MGAGSTRMEGAGADTEGPRGVPHPNPSRGGGCGCGKGKRLTTSLVGRKSGEGRKSGFHPVSAAEDRQMAALDRQDLISPLFDSK